MCSSEFWINCCGHSFRNSSNEFSLGCASLCVNQSLCQLPLKSDGYLAERPGIFGNPLNQPLGMPHHVVIHECLYEEIAVIVARLHTELARLTTSHHGMSQ